MARRILEREWHSAVSQSKSKKEQQIYYGCRYKHGVRLENFPEDYLVWLQAGLPYENTPVKRPTAPRRTILFQSPPVHKQLARE